MTSTLIVRADASTQMGTGHVLRCLALAQAWQDQGGDVVFAMAQSVPALKARLDSEGMKTVEVLGEIGSAKDADFTAALARSARAEWIVLDGYQFTSEYETRLKESGVPCLFIDDLGHAGPYVAEIVLNQNSYANEEMYSNRAPHTQLLLGTAYLLLRREFAKWGERPRQIPRKAKKILVTLGGSDPNNVTLRVIHALQKLCTFDITAKILIGPANPHFKQLYETLLDFPKLTLITDSQAIPEFMAWSDVAVSAGGSTTWELAFMGLPTIFLVLAENQLGVAAGLHEAGTGINFGTLQSQEDESHLTQELSKLLDNHELRVQMSQRGHQLVDGLGTTRVTKMLLNQIHARTKL